MRKLPAQYLAWILWAFVVGLIAVLFVVENVLVPSVRELTTAELVAHMVTLTAMATVGAVVASRRPENLIGWLVLLFPVIGVTGEATMVYARYAVHVNPGALPGGAIAGLLANSMWNIAYGLFPFITLLFPRGTLLSPRWRWVGWGLVAAFGALLASDLLYPRWMWGFLPWSRTHWQFPVPNLLGTPYTTWRGSLLRCFGRRPAFPLSSASPEAVGMSANR